MDCVPWKLTFDIKSSGNETGIIRGNWINNLIADELWRPIVSKHDIDYSE